MHRIFVVGALISLSCATMAERSEPPIATITTTGATEIKRNPEVPNNRAVITIAPECKRVVSCYNALARDLCLNDEKDCTASFSVTTPVDQPRRCKEILSQASDVAAPMLVDMPRYRLPTECQ